MITHIRCIVCNQLKYKGNFIKHRFEYRESAQEFLDAVNFLQGELKTRLADVDNVDRLLASDIYYHHNCKLIIMNKYENSIAKCVLCQETISRVMTIDVNMAVCLLAKMRHTNDIERCCRLLNCFDETKNQFITPAYSHKFCLKRYLGIKMLTYIEIYDEHVTPIIEDMLKRGYYLPLSEIRYRLEVIHPNINFQNHHIKDFLEKKFSEKVLFCMPYVKKDSTIVYPSHITTEQIVAKIQYHNTAKSAGQMLRDQLQLVDFGLEDSFCDKDDLYDSWSNTRMPETLIEFFSGLLNMSKADLISPLYEPIDSEDDFEDDNLPDTVTKQSAKPKVVLAKSLFNTLFYSVHRGRKKAPLHVMLAHSVHDRCKSKELITSLNRLGFCISYTQQRNCKANLTGYVVKKGSECRVPLPAHFNTEEFTIAAADNFDHEDSSTLSGKKSNHDSVTVLFQNLKDGDEQNRKEKISEIGLHPQDTKFVDKLECQKLQHFIYDKKSGKKSVPLPSDFVAVPNPTYEDDQKSSIISAVRNIKPPAEFMNQQQIQCPDNVNELVPTWAGAHALTSTCNLKLKQVGFLPILPYPITRIETVYTVLVNLDSIANTLKQDVLPFACDEGVYHLVIDIYMHNPHIFKNLFPMLGTFHMAKNACRCAGKFLRGSGIEDSLIESEIFGPKVLETVLGGTHYYRSLKGLSIVEDALKRLKSEAFWLEQDPQSFNEEITNLCQLKIHLTELDSKSAKERLTDIKNTSGLSRLLDAFDTFSQKCKEKSEICLYFENYILIVETIKNLVRADREGNFLLHMKTVGELCAIFTGGDGIHYMRCISFYHELLKNLKDKHPELYGNFMQGDFVIKTKKGSFNGVAADMKLEQTIQRSSKSSHGIIGQTRSLGYVTQWQLLYHELLGISNVFRDITNPYHSDSDSETRVHHELAKSKIREINAFIDKVFQFFKDRGNPYCLHESSLKLKNVSSQVIAHDDVKEKHLNFHELSKAKFNDFRERVYVKKTSFLYEKITKFKLMKVDFVPDTKNDSTKDVKMSAKEIKVARKLLNTAKNRFQGALEPILKHDVTSYSPLYDGIYMTNTPNKSQLIGELEAYLTAEHYNEQIPPSATLIVDFMSFVRNQVINSTIFGNFGVLVNTLFKRFTTICPNSFIHVIFDSYMNYSVKGPERVSRGHSSLELAKIEKQTPIPQQIEKFWASSNNKVMLQEFAKGAMIDLAKNIAKDMVLSGVVVNEDQRPCIFVHHDQNTSDIDDLNSDIEEADHRLIPHIEWSLHIGHNNIVVISNDTDVLVLLVHYFKIFSRMGLKKIWIRVGKGDSERFIPVHKLYKRLGPLRKVLLAAHIGTGCDYISKVGTKLGALNAIPEKFLNEFG